MSTFWKVGYCNLSWHPPSLLELQIIPCPLAKSRMLTIGCLSSLTQLMHMREYDKLHEYTALVHIGCLHMSLLSIHKCVFSGSQKVKVGPSVECFGFRGLTVGYAEENKDKCAHSGSWALALWLSRDGNIGSRVTDGVIAHTFCDCVLLGLVAFVTCEPSSGASPSIPRTAGTAGTAGTGRERTTH